MVNKYFNPLRANHLEFAKLLEDELNKNKGKKLHVIKFGDSTQHVFINGNYWMTVDWSKI